MVISSTPTSTIMNIHNQDQQHHHHHYRHHQNHEDILAEMAEQLGRTEDSASSPQDNNNDNINEADELDFEQMMQLPHLSPPPVAMPRQATLTGSPSFDQLLLPPPLQQQEVQQQQQQQQREKTQQQLGGIEKPQQRSMLPSSSILPSQLQLNSTTSLTPFSASTASCSTTSSATGSMHPTAAALRAVVAPMLLYQQQQQSSTTSSTTAVDDSTVVPNGTPTATTARSNMFSPNPQGTNQNTNASLGQVDDMLDEILEMVETQVLASGNNKIGTVGEGSSNESHANVEYSVVDDDVNVDDDYDQEYFVPLNIPSAAAASFSSTSSSSRRRGDQLNLEFECLPVPKRRRSLDEATLSLLRNTRNLFEDDNHGNEEKIPFGNVGSSSSSSGNAFELEEQNLIMSTMFNGSSSSTNNNNNMMTAANFGMNNFGSGGYGGGGRCGIGGGGGGGFNKNLVMRRRSEGDKSLLDDINKAKSFFETNKLEAEDDTNSSSSARFRSYQTDTWNERFCDLLKFQKEFGHCLVPHNWPGNVVLAQWVKRQRYQYKLLSQPGKQSTLSEERLNLLNAMGFVWDSHKAAWEEKYTQLVDYQKRYGHCNVSGKVSQPLCIWVKCQRRQRKLFEKQEKSTMTTEKITRLDQLGFDWNPRNM